MYECGYKERKKAVEPHFKALAKERQRQAGKKYGRRKGGKVTENFPGAIEEDDEEQEDLPEREAGKYGKSGGRGKKKKTLTQDFAGGFIDEGEEEDNEEQEEKGEVRKIIAESFDESGFQLDKEELIVQAGKGGLRRHECRLLQIY